MARAKAPGAKSRLHKDITTSDRIEGGQRSAKFLEQPKVMKQCSASFDVNMALIQNTVLGCWHRQP
jgi:hypothetical protein